MRQVENINKRRNLDSYSIKITVTKWAKYLKDKLPNLISKPNYRSPINKTGLNCMGAFTFRYLSNKYLYYF